MDAQSSPMLRALTLPGSWGGELLQMMRPVFRRSSTFGLFALLGTCSPPGWGVMAVTTLKSRLGVPARHDEWLAVSSETPNGRRFCGLDHRDGMKSPDVSEGLPARVHSSRDNARRCRLSSCLTCCLRPGGAARTTALRWRPVNPSSRERTVRAAPNASSPDAATRSWPTCTGHCPANRSARCSPTRTGCAETAFG